MHLNVISPEKAYESDPKLKSEDVEILQEWLKKQAHLPKLEEIQVILFLHSCYYSIEAAKNTIDVYFTRRTLFPDLFRCPSEDVLRKYLSVLGNVMLPKKTPQGCDIYVASLIDCKPENFIFVAQVILANLVEVLHVHENGCLGGLVMIFDFKGSSLAHLAKVNFMAMKRCFDHLQEGTPVRIQGLHWVNAPSFVDKVLAILKPVLSSQLFNLIQVHSSVDNLYKHIPKESLPEDFGGDLPTIQKLQEETVKKIFDNLDFFKWHEGQTVDESKRIEKSKVVDSNFGMEGTFKKLSID